MEIKRYLPMTEEDISTLLKQLKNTFPIGIETDKGSNPPTRIGLALLEFTPPSEKDILEYQEKLYPEWIKKCEALFRNLHTIKNVTAPLCPTLHISLRNAGTRPSENTLIVFNLKGTGLKLIPMTERVKQTVEKFEVALPKPPQAPQGQWKDRWMALTDPLGSFGNLSQSIDASPRLLRDEFEQINRRLSRNPENFYWTSKVETPTTKWSTQCERWRHLIDAEDFTFALHIDTNENMVAGIIEVEAHADNLSETVVASCPIRIKIKNADVIDEALELIEKLTPPKKLTLAMLLEKKSSQNIESED